MASSTAPGQAQSMQKPRVICTRSCVRPAIVLQNSSDMPQPGNLQKARRAATPGVSLSVAVLQICGLGHVRLFCNIFRFCGGIADHDLTIATTRMHECFCGWKTRSLAVTPLVMPLTALPLESGKRAPLDDPLQPRSGFMQISSSSSSCLLDMLQFITTR